MIYSNFYLELHGQDLDNARVKVHTDAYGLSSATGNVNLKLGKPTIEAELTELQRLSTDLELADRDSPQYQALKDVQKRLGIQLCEAVLHGEVDRIFQRVRGQMDMNPQQSMRIRLVCEDNESGIHPLASLPWELLFVGEEDRFLGCRRRFPISRSLLGLRPVSTFGADEAPRLLLVESNPEMNEMPIDASAEKQAIHNVLASVDGGHLIEAPPILETIRARIQSEEISIFHFMGHGGFDEESGQAWIVMTDAQNQPVRHLAEELAAQLQDLDTLKLVVLSSCYTTTLPRRVGQNLFDTLAPALLRAGIAAVVGMQFPVFNISATEFSRHFYTQLIQGKPVDVAAAEARRAMQSSAAHPMTNAQWSLPVVYLGDHYPHTDARAVSELPAQPVDTPTNREALTVGIRSFPFDHAKDLEKQVERCLLLDDLFDGWQPRVSGAWNEKIRPELLEFLEPLRSVKRPIEFRIFANTSIAFTAGFALPMKSGLTTRIHQFTPPDKHALMTPERGTPPTDPLWSVEELEIDSDGTDVACAVSLTHNIFDEARAYVQTSCPSVHRILHVRADGQHHSEIVRDGAHAYYLGQELIDILQKRDLSERQSPLHLFISGPNAFAFFFGRQAHALGTVQLYEYPFGEKVGLYWPSITLPPSPR